MQITIICPSSLTKESNIKSLCDDYIKRMHDDVKFIEATTKISKNDSDDLVKKKQGESLLIQLDKLSTQTAIIALDERGQKLSSPDLAKKISNLTIEGYSSLCFVIGGAFGLSSEVLNRAHFKLSFGAMVWPHRLVGLMLLEQIYRAQQINAGHPYHKE